MNDEPISNPSVLAPAGLPSVGELLRSSLERYRAHWKLWVLIVLPAAIIGGLHAFLSSLPMFVRTPSMPSPEGVPGILALGLVLTVVQFFSTLALLTAVSEPVSVGEAYRRGARLFTSYLLIGLLSGLIILGGFTLLIIPGVIFAIWFGLAPYVLVSEQTRGMDALLKSKAYISGHFFAVLGRLFVLILLAVLVSLLLSILPEPIPTTLISLFFVPFSTLYCFKIYESLKALKGSVPNEYPRREKMLYVGLGVVGFLLLGGLVVLVSVLAPGAY